METEFYKESTETNTERRQEKLKFKDTEAIQKLYQSVSVKSTYDQDHRYIHEMQSMRSPVPLITSDFGQIIPIFSSKLINESVTLMLNNPDEGLEMLEYLCKGPPENFQMLSFKELAPNFVDNMPFSINITAKIFSIAPDGCNFPIEFIKCGGLSKLHDFRTQKDLLFDIANIFLCCSKYPISFPSPVGTTEKCVVGVSRDVGFHDIDMSDGGDEFADEMPIEILFRELTDALLKSMDHDILIITLEAFKNIVDACDTYNKLIANSVIANFDMFNPEMQRHAFEILAKTLKDYESPPEFSKIWSKVSEILNCGDLDLTTALCSFVSAVVSKYNVEQLAGLELFHEFVAFAADCKFQIKHPIVECLAYIVNHCTISSLGELVTEDVINLFLAFLEDKSSEELPSILKALTRIAELTPESYHLELIGEYIDNIEDMAQDCEEEETSIEARHLFDVMMAKKED